MRSLLRRLAFLLRRDDVAAEIEFHRVERQRALERGGLAADAAEASSRRAMGNVMLAREDARAVWLPSWAESCWQDLRHGARLLRRSPVTTIVAVLTLALGIGANTAVYSLIDGALFRTLPVAEPERLVFCTDIAKAGVGTRDFTLTTFEALRDNNRTLAALAAYDASRISASVDGQPEMLLGDFVSGDYFEVLRTHAAIGRLLLPSDDRRGGPRVLVISDEYWRRRFGGDAAAVGRTLQLGGMPFTIVGVTASAFHGRRVSGRWADISVPLSAHSSLALHDHTTFELIGRLRPGVTLEQASAELDAVYRRVLDRDPEASALDDGHGRIGLSSGAHGELDGNLGPNDRRQVVAVTAIVALVLVVACVNVATLQLARGSARRKEMAVRTSIGAGSGRLIRQLLTESVLLSALGGAAALLVARPTAGILRHALPLPDLTFDPARDAATLAFTGAVSLVSGLLFGLAPALAARRLDISAILKGAEVNRAPAGWRSRAGMFLLVGQVALSIALLMSTGLLVRSVGNLRRVDPGVDADRVLRTDVYPALLRYDRPRENRLYRSLVEALETTPGIDAAALARYALFHAGVNYASPKLFATLGVPVTQGRDLTEADVASREHVAVINAPAAERWYPGERAIGRLVPAEFTDGLGPLTIVGIVPPINPSYRRRQPAPSLFVPYTLAENENLGQASLYVRTRGDAVASVAAVRQAVRAVEPQLALLDLGPMTADLDDSIAPHRATAELLGVCGVLALMLVALGLYGTMTQAVTQRTKELGIRLSLGAQPAALHAMVLREAAAIAAIGLAAGIPLAVASARGLSHLLFGVGAVDPITVAGVVLVTLAATLAAVHVPARRAARVDPLLALRAD